MMYTRKTKAVDPKIREFYLDCKRAARMVENLKTAIDHLKPYNTQLELLSDIERAKFNFKAAGADCEAYIRIHYSNMQANLVSFKLQQWTKKIDS